MGKYSTFPDDAALERIADGRVISYVRQHAFDYVAALESPTGLRVAFAWNVPCPKGNKKPYWEPCIWSDALELVVLSSGERHSEGVELRLARACDTLLALPCDWTSRSSVKDSWAAVYECAERLAK